MSIQQSTLAIIRRLQRPGREINGIRNLAQRLGIRSPITLRKIFNEARNRGIISSNIRHVFVLMLENRSFDHIFGFSNIEGTDAKSGERTTIDGVSGKEFHNVDPETGRSIPVSHPAEQRLPDSDDDPGHEFVDTLVQLAGISAVSNTRDNDDDFVLPDGEYPNNLTNSGFIASARRKGSPHPEAVMHCFSPEQLPVLNALAREFVVCDRWFSSMPGPTFPNRFFVHAASAGELDDSPSGIIENIEQHSFRNGTIFDRLDQNRISWDVFAPNISLDIDTDPGNISDLESPLVPGDNTEIPGVLSLDYFKVSADIGLTTEIKIKGKVHLQEFDDFSRDINSSRYSRNYIFIEPRYDVFNDHFSCGDSMHPSADAARGERLIKTVYETIRRSPIWENSVLVITFDEHGGFFDHVSPPSAVSPGDIREGKTHRFKFDRYGLRVPALIISPLIPKNLIDHTVYDHTSILATLERLFNMSPLTRRDEAANDFLHLFSLNAPRTDCPTELPSTIRPTNNCDDIRDHRERNLSDNRPIGGTERGFLNIAANFHMAMVPLAERNSVIERLSRIRTMGDANTYLRDLNGVFRNLRVKRQ